MAAIASQSVSGGSLSNQASVLPGDTALGMHAIKTFIVEDSPIILDNLIATLEELASVTVVGSAPDESTAVEQLSHLDDLDLLIIDVFLKSGSGLEVLRNATQYGSAAKRVVLTNYATPNMREKCRLLGADRVFDKSNELDDLIAYCTRLAETRDDSSGNSPD